MDDQLVTCPFDPLHKVKITRIQTHIVKCEKNHPGYEICPFNARHRILPPAYKDHLVNCPSRAAFISEKLPPKVVARIQKPFTQPSEKKSYKPDTIQTIRYNNFMVHTNNNAVDDDDDDWDD